MSHFKKSLSIFAAAIFLGLAAATFAGAQDQPQRPLGTDNPQARPVRLLDELGLTPEQVQQIKAINQERRGVVQAAQQRWKVANRRLDEAVYADNASEEQIAELTRVAQIAQGELIRERTLTEFRIRQVLTPDQLVRFRAMRERLRERVENRQADRPVKPTQNQPRAIERLRQRRGQSRPQQ